MTPMQCLSMCREAFKNKQSQPQDVQRQRTSHQTMETESILGNMVHTAGLTPLHEKHLLESKDLEAFHCYNMFKILAYSRKRGGCSQSRRLTHGLPQAKLQSLSYQDI